MKAIRFFFVLCVTAFPALAQEAPFGFRWGQSLDELAAAGVKGAIRQDEENISVLQSGSVSGAGDDTDLVRLIVDRHFGLQRIEWASKNLGDDPSGQKAVALYHKMKTILSDEYGAPRSSAEEIGVVTYTGPDDFFKCLATDGCGAYASVWRSGYSDVAMHLVGTSAGKGWLEIVYVGPDWEDVVAARKKRRTHP
jgi:hypothetical protein